MENFLLQIEAPPQGLLLPVAGQDPGKKVYLGDGVPLFQVLQPVPVADQILKNRRYG